MQYFHTTIFEYYNLLLLLKLLMIDYNFSLKFFFKDFETFLCLKFKEKFVKLGSKR